MKHLLTSAAVAMALAVSPAGAGPLAFGPTAGPVWNIARVPGSMLLADGKTGFSVSAKDSLGDLGTADFGKEMMAASNATPPIYPVIHQTLPGESLKINFGAAGELTGDVVWSDVTGGKPNFSGTFDYTSTGYQAFLNLFGAAGNASIDLIATMTMMTLQQWDTTYGPIGLAGDPPMSAVEPASLALLGFGLLMGGLLRLRRSITSSAHKRSFI